MATAEELTQAIEQIIPSLKTLADKTEANDAKAPVFVIQRFCEPSTAHLALFDDYWEKAEQLHTSEVDPKRLISAEVRPILADLIVGLLPVEEYMKLAASAIAHLSKKQ